MLTTLTLLATLLSTAPARTVTYAALDCSKGDTDAEMDECDPDYILGLSTDGYYLTR